MALKVPTASALTLLAQSQALWNGAGPLKIRLYKNNYTPVNGTVIGDLTQADFNGYTAGGTTLANWTTPTTVSSRAQTQADPVTWTKGVGGTGNSIYGYYVVDGSGNLLWAERDPAAPIDLNTDGKQYLVLARFTEVTEF